MFSKILIGGGSLIIFVGVIGIVSGILRSFQALKFNESAGIGAVGGGLQLALVGTILCLVGLLVLVFGCINLYRDKRAGK